MFTNTFDKHQKYFTYLVYTPLLVCIIIMIPRLLSPQFGLLDDGRSLSVAKGISLGKWGLSWDLVAERLRPIYWAAFAFWYMLAGGHPFWFFVGNLMIFTATTWILIRLVIVLGGSKLQTLATGLFFALSPPVIENVYTLSKSENLQTFLLCTAIWLIVISVKSFRGLKYWISLIGAGLLILAASFTKENTLVMVPISLIWWVLTMFGRLKHMIIGTFAEKVARWIALTSLLSGGVLYLVRSIIISPKIIGVGYSSFILNRDQILNGLVRWGGWLLRDFTWLLPMAAIVLVGSIFKHRLPRSGMWSYAGVWMVFWLGLLIPWYYAVGYYLLPFTAGAAILAGVLFNEICAMIKEDRQLWKVTGILTLVLVLLLLISTQANSISDASVQLAQDAANTSVMEYVVNNAPIGSLVVVNIQLANEYIEQMQLMLVDYYDRSDLQLLNYQGQALEEFKTHNSAIYILVGDVGNQPKMTVRMGLNEESLKVWNAVLLPLLNSWHEAYQVSRDPRILSIDFPRLLCPVIYRENYCSAGGGLVNYQIFHYQWTVYTIR